MTLPVAIKRAGLNWNQLPEEQHYILGGLMRGKPLPDDREIYTVHYRNSTVLREVGLNKVGQRFLSQQIGVAFVRRLNPDAPDTAGAEAEVQNLGNED